MKNIYLTISFASILLISLGACSSTGGFNRRADSLLPIELQQSAGGNVRNFRAYERANRLYVAGTVRKYSSGTILHVDVLLIGQSGKVVAMSRDAVNPAHPAPGGGKGDVGSFVVSFPFREAQKAVKIRIIVDVNPHEKP